MRKQYPVSISCEVLEVNASGYFTWARQHKAKTKRKFVVTTNSKHNLPVAPDLVQRKFNPEAPNQLCSGDITYIATDEGCGCTWRPLLTCSVVRWWAGV
jgi:transposase InsO family protein